MKDNEIIFSGDIPAIRCPYCGKIHGEYNLYPEIAYTVKYYIDMKKVESVQFICRNCGGSFWMDVKDKL